MSYTLWLSVEEERILDAIMRHEGTRTKEQAVIRAIREMGALIEAERQPGETPAGVVAGLPGQSAR